MILDRLKNPKGKRNMLSEAKSKPQTQGTKQTKA